MKTIDLAQTPLNIEELLRLASMESLTLIAGDGKTFTLEAADAFEKEIGKLGQNEQFIAFLKKRSKETGVFPLDEFEKELKLDKNDS